MIVWENISILGIGAFENDNAKTVAMTIKLPWKIGSNLKPFVCVGWLPQQLDITTLSLFYLSVTLCRSENRIGNQIMQ